MHFKNKKFPKVVSIAVILAAVVLGSLSAEPISEVQNLPTTVLLEPEAPSLATGILSMSEEQKLAREVYLASHDALRTRTVSKIARGEKRMIALIEAQDLEIYLSQTDDPDSITRFAKRLGRAGNHMHPLIRQRNRHEARHSERLKAILTR